jgi:hypothetical protein
MPNNEFLKNVVPLHTLTEEYLAHLAKRVLVKGILKDAAVCREGDTDKGSLKIIIHELRTRLM